jgi:hypothetical protein
MAEIYNLCNCTGDRELRAYMLRGSGTGGNHPPPQSGRLLYSNNIIIIINMYVLCIKLVGVYLIDFASPHPKLNCPQPSLIESIELDPSLRLYYAWEEGSSSIDYLWYDIRAYTQTTQLKEKTAASIEFDFTTSEVATQESTWRIQAIKSKVRHNSYMTP